MHYEEMLTWLLFYTSLLDLKKVPPQDVADPGGLVKSQVIEADDGNLRIILNASQSHRTQSSRFLAEVFGSGVQHIAFATDDILATVARLKPTGAARCRYPENYYDDLEAKFNLAPELLERSDRTPSSTTAMSTASTSRSTRKPSSSASSSRSWSGGTMLVTAPPMPLSGSRLRQESSRLTVAACNPELTLNDDG